MMEGKERNKKEITLKRKENKIKIK